jgi:hypothetical protein
MLEYMKMEMMGVSCSFLMLSEVRVSLLSWSSWFFMPSLMNFRSHSWTSKNAIFKRHHHKMLSRIVNVEKILLFKVCSIMLKQQIFITVKMEDRYIFAIQKS